MHIRKLLGSHLHFSYYDTQATHEAKLILGGKGKEEFTIFPRAVDCVCFLSRKIFSRSAAKVRRPKGSSYYRYRSTVP